MPKLPPPVERVLAAYLASEDVAIGVGLSWALGIPVAALVGFYFFTIIGTNHVVDLQAADIVRGFWGAASGALAGVAFACVVTALYPRYVAAG